MIRYGDLSVGDTFDCGTTRVDADDVVAFAEQFDPQPMHTDPQAAADGPFDGLVASGWHTASLCMRRMVETFIGAFAEGGGLGVDELRWRTPLRPGDELHVRVVVSDLELWDEDRGVVRMDVTATNQRGETVLTMTPLAILAR